MKLYVIDMYIEQIQQETKKMLSFMALQKTYICIQSSISSTVALYTTMKNGDPHRIQYLKYRLLLALYTYNEFLFVSRSTG